MPAAFEVARAAGSERMTDTMGSSRSERIVFFRVARPQIIFGRHHGRARRGRMRVEALVHDGLDAAIRAHLDDIDPPGVGALEHPVLLAELGKHAVDRAFGAERLAAGDAVERLFFLQYPQRGVPRLEIKARLEADDFLGTGRFAKPALHAEAF